MRRGFAANSMDARGSIARLHGTTQRIGRVGRINNDAVRPHCIRGQTKQPRLRMRRVNNESSGHDYKDDAILTLLRKHTPSAGMKLLGDFLPIIAFFIVFKLVGGTSGIYAATASAITVALASAIYCWVRYRKIERQQLVMLAILLVMGGLTLALHDERFIKWKPTVVSWVTAGAFLVVPCFGLRKTLVERMFGANIAAPNHVWRQLNVAWIVFFISLGWLNLYFAFHWPTDVWVNFKVFGTFGLSLGFAFLQSIYLMRFDTSTQSKEKE